MGALRVCEVVWARLPSGAQERIPQWPLVSCTSLQQNQCLPEGRKVAGMILSSVVRVALSGIPSRKSTWQGCIPFPVFVVIFGLFYHYVMTLKHE